MSAEAHPVPQRPPVDEPVQEHDALLSFIKDNLEAIAVAVVMALVIKHFCVEAFKIPTSSMRPTLLGDSDSGEGRGDRILVDKSAYLLGAPERWDVIVFRYPLNRTRNFIKRIGGLQGEHLRISSDGDLWVRAIDDERGEAALRIPQKPRRVREQFYRAVYPPPPVEEDDDAFRPQVALDHFWRADGGAPNAWRVESYAHFAFSGGATAGLRGVPSILEHTTPRSWASTSNAGELVRDVRFALRVEVDAPAGDPDLAAPPPTRLTLRWRPDDRYLAVLTLSTEAGASEAFVRRGTEVHARQALDVRLVPGSVHDVELEYVDGRLRVRYGDRELCALEDGRVFGDTYTESGEQRFSMEAEGGALHVRDLAIDRDLRYENSWDGNPSAEQRGIDIPEDHYFMLGDNTSNSSDSRRWREVTVHLKGGREIRYDYGQAPDYLGGSFDDTTRKRVADVDGITRTWFEEDEDPELGSETRPAPFVSRDLIVGRAFVVFWPCWPEFPGRLGFIR